MADAQLNYTLLDDALEPLLAAPHWYVGFSGGVDSTVLLHLLQQWCRRRAGAPALSAIHINHGLQAASDEWQVHCEWVCRVLQLPLVSFQAKVAPGSRGLEAAAREARYSIFENQLAPGDVLFLGHHADDQVETFFLRLLRGAGVQGLAGMPAARGLGSGCLARPLLQFPRAELERYATAHGLHCIEDPSNRDSALDRNFLRHEVLPLLAARWPGYRQTVGRASGHIAAASEMLAQAVPAPKTLYSAMGDPGVALADLDFAAAGSAALALRHWLQAAGLPAPDQSALGEFLRQLAATQTETEARPRLQSSAYTLQRYREAIYLLPECGASDFAAPAEALALFPGEVKLLPAGTGRYWLAAGSGAGLRLGAGDPIELAWRRGGERCRPQGRSDRTTLKKLLQERAVPPWWRDWVPLLYLQGELLAVGDLWLCDSSRWMAAPDPGETLWQPLWKRNITTAFD